MGTSGTNVYGCPLQIVVVVVRRRRINCSGLFICFFFSALFFFLSRVGIFQSLQLRLQFRDLKNTQQKGGKKKEDISGKRDTEGVVGEERTQEGGTGLAEKAR